MNMNGLKVWSSERNLADNNDRLTSSPSVLTASAPPTHPDDNMAVLDATKGMNEAQQQAWREEQMKIVIADMEKRGIKVDRSKIGGIDQDDGSHFGDPTDPSDRNVHMGGERFMTVAQYRAVLAHEIAHSQQDPKWIKEHPDLAEHQADEVMAKTYGAQFAVDTLQILHMYGGEKAGDPHGTIKERQEAIIKKFAGEHAHIRDMPMPKYANTWPDGMASIVHTILNPHMPSFSTGATGAGEGQIASNNFSSTAADTTRKLTGAQPAF